MKHTFRINVSGKGYTLYSGETLLSYQEYNLGIKSDGISENYLSAQERLDLLMERQVSRWYLSVVRKTINENPVVAYGCFFSAKDEKNRSGLRFIHAIESTSDWSAESIVLAIIQMLSSKNTSKIRELISGIAIGTYFPNELTDYMASVYGKQDLNNSSTSTLHLNTRPIKEIRQDCSGATAFAWLAMTISHYNASPPWEIYEKYMNNTDTVSIFSSSSEAEKELSLSSFLYAISHNQKLIFQSFYKPRKRSRRNKASSTDNIYSQSNDKDLVNHGVSSKNHLALRNNKSIWRKLLDKLLWYIEKISRKPDKVHNSTVAKSVVTIQSLLNKLSERYNSNHPTGQEIICRKAVDTINKDSNLQSCITSALKDVSIKDLSKAINHPVAASVIDRAKKNMDLK
jgi:hypothetical protein